MTPFRTATTTRPDAIYEVMLYLTPATKNDWNIAVFETPLGVLAKASKIEDLRIAEHPELNALINWKEPIRFNTTEVQHFVNAIRDSKERARA